MTTTPSMAPPAVDDRPRNGMRGIETDYAEVLAEVLGVGSVSVESHFFNDLCVDSLTMAHFCARVRKRDHLPSVSMKDIYAHPTIRSLAEAVIDSGPAATKPAVGEVRRAPEQMRTGEFLLCGALQAVFYLGYSYLGVIAAIKGYQWITAGSEGAGSYIRLILFSASAFLVVCGVPIAAKWLLIGRWRPGEIRIWSLAYVRFWIVKTLIRSNPGAYLFVGSPLYRLYLNALGARVGPRVVILSRDIPVCTDLLTIGAGSVIRRETSFLCYRAEGGRIERGPVTLGRDVFVGEMSVLDINTSMGDGAQLGHSSSLHAGQAVPAGERWHGSPARRTETNYVRVPAARCGSIRRVMSGAITLTAILFLWAPLLEGGFAVMFRQVSSTVEALDPGLASVDGGLTVTGLLVESIAFSAVLFFGAVVTGLLILGIVPRALNLFIKPEEVYPLYGFRFSVHRMIGALCRLRFFPIIFGDSSYIVHFLTWVGWRLSPVVQTGENFGSEVTTSNPLLTFVGSGTMIGDGINVIADEVSNSSFRVSKVHIGRRNFVGNYVNYPSGGRTGENCLLATKVMVPIDGPIREGVGLLGSPPFEIPRSVERDSRFDHLRTGEALRSGLAGKNRFNLRTIGLFLLTRWFGVFIIVLIDLAGLELFYDAFAHAVMALLFALSAVVAAVYCAFVERCLEAISPLPPAICSIYNPDFWWVERVWKLHPIQYLHIFDGTPFKSLLWRLTGVRFGKRVFDDGFYVSEPLLTTVGDDCVLNHRAIIQCDSQEDGTYKSGPTSIGVGCTIGVGALVHYSVTMGDGSSLAADSFLMKGEEVPPGARWGGNPAKEV